MFPNLEERRQQPGHAAVRRRAADAGAWPASSASGPGCSCSTRSPRGWRRSSSRPWAGWCAQLKERGFTIVLVEQNFRFAAPLADRHYVVEHGRIVDMIPQDELASRTEQLHRFLGV